jgi:anti-sigma factor RsiW
VTRHRRSGPHDGIESPCDRARQAMSARLDGERTDIPGGEVEAHLADCPDCRLFAAGSIGLTGTGGLAASRQAPDALQEHLALELARTVGSAPRSRARRPRTVRADPTWRRRLPWVGALTPAALAAVFVPLGALSSPHEIPSHVSTPCTVSLTSLPTSALR